MGDLNPAFHALLKRRPLAKRYPHERGRGGGIQHGLIQTQGSYRACPEPVHSEGSDQSKQLLEKARKGQRHETRNVHDGGALVLRREGERENAYSIFSGALVRSKQACWPRSDGENGKE
jgi:hypothetical protein